jgi:MoaA/NifB/PqqE/SkfB family radical SAM enzyme/quercetin dioxygenase-like cupin family protein
MVFNRIRPTRIRLETSSVCQLACPSCPIHGGAARPVVGNGFLKLSSFRDLIESNPRLKNIELSNYGEILLNPDLLGILEYAHERGVALRADTGVNLNRVSDVVLEGLVKYGLRSMTCSIDGASDQTYRLYRVNGDFSTVIGNIRKLNAFKSKYQSELPRLAWQFVVFGHNEHEISQARELAGELDMMFYLKLAWDPEFSPVTNKAVLRREIGVADREEYRQRFGVDYAWGTCYELWNSPQINWDGKVLGCCRNFWGDFGANAFEDGLLNSVNSPKMRYAREMLLGKKPTRDDIPCSTCSLYAEMRTEGRWLMHRQISKERRRVARSMWRSSEKVRKSIAYRGARFIYHSVRPRANSGPQLTSLVHPLEIPLPPDEVKGWKPYSVFNGHTTGLRAWDCHVSVLTKGTCPHPPHKHADEEILMLLSGEVDLLLPDLQTPAGNGRTPLRPGQFVYYPSNYAHTLQTTSEVPANYLMFRWSAGSKLTRSPLAHGLYTAFNPEPRDEATSGFSSRLVFEAPTKYLRKLHCHASTLAAGEGYDAHIDEYDVAIIVLEGEVETLGERVVPHGVILYPGGEPHGMHNPGQTTARYVVFEFHHRGSGLADGLRGSSVGGVLRTARRGLRGVTDMAGARSSRRRV